MKRVKDKIINILSVDRQRVVGVIVCLSWKQPMLLPSPWQRTNILSVVLELLMATAINWA